MRFIIEIPKRSKKVMVVVNDDFLKEYYHLEYGMVLKVLGFANMKSHGNCKKKKTWKEYQVQIRQHYLHNHYLQLGKIWLTDSECKPTTFKLSPI